MSRPVLHIAKGNSPRRIIILYRYIQPGRHFRITYGCKSNHRFSLTCSSQRLRCGIIFNHVKIADLCYCSGIYHLVTVGSDTHSLKKDIISHIHGLYTAVRQFIGHIHIHVRLRLIILDFHCRDRLLFLFCRYVPFGIQNGKICLLHGVCRYKP